MKRFYADVTITHAPEAPGFHILLDGKPIRTPLRHVLQPLRATLADAIAAEWQAQDTKILPDTMPMTQMQTMLQDRCATERDVWQTEILAFLETDLLCYLTDDMPEIAANQANIWTPLRTWFADWLNIAPLVVTTGLGVDALPVPTITKLQVQLSASTPEILMVWRYVAGLTGSCVLGAALAHGVRDANAVFAAAQLEEMALSKKAHEDVYGQEPYQEKMQGVLRRELHSCIAFLTV
ncbi:MAG: ATP12 family protein [Pseudomonadota bacterium]